MHVVMTSGEEVDVKLAWEQDGIGVHRGIDAWRNKRTWCVAHVSSGLRISQHVKTKSEAVAIAKALLPLADWQQPGDNLKNYPSLRIDVKRIGFYGTSQY